MEIKVTKRINESTQISVKAEGKNLQDVLFQVNPILNAPKHCGLCRKNNISIKSKYVTKDGGYKYTSFVCLDCGGYQQLGQYKTIEGCFFLKDWQEAYKGDNQG